MDSVFLYIESNGIFAILLVVILLQLGRKPAVSGRRGCLGVPYT